MLKKALLLTTFVVSGAMVHYATPQTDIVRAIGVETKRVDIDGSQAGQGTLSTRDVYFVQTEEIGDATPMVYRNEDNLLYAKWNSADTQARSQSLAANKELVAVSHYGWRVRLFSVFPNVLSVKPVEEAYTPIPYLFFATLALVWGAMFLAYRKIGNLGQGITDRRRERRANRSAGRTSSGSASGSSTGFDLSDLTSGSDGGGDSD